MSSIFVFIRGGWDDEVSYGGRMCRSETVTVVEVVLMIKWTSMSRVSKNNRKNIWKVISVLLVIVWMVMIFVMSNFPAEVSDRQSGVD